ncbi:MAG: nucleotidyltransferase domain-containing protein [Candidatus Caldarchaeum sp.]|nr:nucleotidyltransferase domain-containing protein [Candidatus Caldarchaeales archaeon]MDJ0271976.1 nucleotidyltransferase domain-containing protein [Candidatus Caldarchaeales archaeon]
MTEALLEEPYRTLAQKLVESLHRRLGDRLVSVAVFGSVARGEAGKESDLDVMVVCEKLPKNRLDRTELFIECEKDLDKFLDTLYERGYGVSISPIILTPQEAARIPSILLDMTEDAVILYDKDSFLTNLLNSLRANLEKMGAERVWIGRKWYWRLWKGGGVKRVKINGQSGDGQVQP